MATALELFDPPWYNASDIGGFVHRKIEITQSLLERFWSKVKKTDTCWLWTAYKNRQGYGRIGIGNAKSINATRVSWVIHNGSIPDNDFVCHKCDNPSCVNPDHLFLGSRQDNIDDMMIKKRSKHFKDNKYYGVRWEERDHEGKNRRGRWRSFICVDGKIKKLGAHNSLLDAARNYDRIAYIVYNEREKLNFPDEYHSNHWD